MKYIKKPIFIILTLSLAIFVFSFSACAINENGEIVVVLDPGHGGNDPGTVAGTEYESVYDLKLALEIKKNLDSDGRFATYLTRTEDVSLTKLERCAFANEHNADICISVHFDANNSDSFHGVSGYVSVVPKYQKKSLAESILSKVSVASGIEIYEKGVQAIEDRGSKIYYWSDEYNWSFADSSVGTQKRDYYGMLKWGAYFGIPTVIIEHGFLTNPSDRAIIEDEGTIESMGVAEANAIISYYTGHTHSFGSITTDFPSNCLFVGKESQKCTVCGARQSISSLPDENEKHYWVKTKTVEAGCEKDGYTEYTCEFSAATGSDEEGMNGYCSLHTKRETIPATGHNYKIVSHTEASHGVDGKTVYVCQNCGDKYTETVKGESHNFVFTEKTELSCTQDESNVYTCSVCGEKKIDIIKKAKGHNMTNLIQTLPTCTECGLNDFTCSVCGEHITETVEPLGHNYEIIGTEDGDCMHYGSITEKCTVCGDVKTTENTYYGAHNPISNGDGTFICSVCGETVKHTIKPASAEQNNGESPVQTASVFSESKIIAVAGGAVIISAAAAVIFKKILFDEKAMAYVPEPLSEEKGNTAESKEKEKVE